MTEGLVMSLLGGVLGFAVATAATDLLVGLAPQGIPRAESIRVDPVVLAFAGGLAVLVGLVCGIAPAVHLSGSKFGSALAEVGRSTTSGRRANRLRSVLVIAEFALSVVLLVGTGLLVQSFWRIQGVDPGFRMENVLTMGIPLPNTRYQDLENRIRFTTDLMDRVSNLPGVIAGGITTSLPLTASANQTPAFKTEAGELDSETAERSQVDLIAVTPGYFEAVGMTRLAGRDLEWTDRGDGRRVAVVDHRLVEHFWPEGDPIGRQFRISGVDVEVVGVVRQARQYRLHEDDRPQVYLPHAQNPNRGINIAVRSDGPPADLARSVRALVAEVDPNQAVSNVATLEQIVGTSLSQRRFTMVLMAGFGIAAMVLAAIGLYGVTGYSVSQRFQEIGLRMALGADRISVFKLVFGQMTHWVGVGLAVGILGALSLSGLISRLLVDVSARDVKTLAGVVVVLAAVAAIATYLPAARAGRIDPTVAMRSE
jgi:putative ABC transport system permease protein